MRSWEGIVVALKEIRYGVSLLFDRIDPGRCERQGGRGPAPRG